MISKKEFISGSDNVFIDLGIANPGLEMAKAEIATAIRNSIRSRKLNQKEAAEFLGVDQPKISALMNGKISGYTYDRLLSYLEKFDRRVTLHISSEKEELATS